MSIVSTIQEIVRQELRKVRITELGVVETVCPHSSGGDDDNYGCDVRLKNSGLLLRRVPITTGHIGTVAIPNKGDLVLLAFDMGDVNQPLVVGRLYNDEDRPPLNRTDEIIFRLPLAKPDDNTIKGAIRNIRSNDPPREIIFQMTPKITLQANDNRLKAVAGNTEMQLDEPGETGGTVTIFAGGTKITMQEDGDVTVEAGGNITLKTETGDLTMEAMNISIKSTLDTSIEADGGQVTVTGTLGATIDGGISATVQAATISVNGVTSFAPA